MKIKLLLLLLPFLLILSACQKDAEPHPVAKDGELILSREDFLDPQLIELKGEWKFFWEELLTESEVIKRLEEEDTENILLPSSWKSVTDTPFGYGTYYLKVTLPNEKVGTALALTMTDQSTSYTLLVNGVRLASNGFVGTSAETSKPEYSNRLVYFTPRNKELNIVLHVSNFVHPAGGAASPIYLGTSQLTTSYYTKNLGITTFIIGAILVMGVYELCIYFFRREERSFLYFGLISIFISFYSFMMPPDYFNKVMPSLSWEWSHRLEIICMYFVFILFLLWWSSVYSKEAHHLLFGIGITAGAIATVLTCVTSPVFYMQLLNYFYIMFGFYIIYFLVIQFIAFRRGKTSSLINLLASLLFFTSVVNDVLLSFGMLHTRPFAIIGFFFYVVIQSLNLSRDYAKKFDQTERMSKDLKKLNSSLDEIIKERTAELNQKNEALKRLTLVDGLTGLYNRRYFDEYLDKYFKEALTNNQPLSFIMIDMDNFKQYNDTKGHLAGDELLRTCSQLIKEMFLEPAFVARYGGEEFAVVLPNTSTQQALLKAEDIRLRIAEQKLSAEKDHYVTISLGLSSTEQHAFRQKEELIDRADQALYQSKKNGKNRVTFL